LAIFRSRTAPIGIVLGRYNGLQVEQRLCLHCKNIFEHEAHALLHNSLYDSIRLELLQSVNTLCNGCDNLTDIDKVIKAITS
jgi:hypothetical protein